MDEPTVWVNPACSKCRTTQALLTDHGIDVRYVEYLAQAPEPAELRRVLTFLGTSDPRTIARPKEPLWTELGLDDASDDAILEALHRHPILIERPIVIIGDRAVIARPPERVLDMLDELGLGELRSQPPAPEDRRVARPSSRPERQPTWPEA